MILSTLCSQLSGLSSQNILRRCSCLRDIHLYGPLADLATFFSNCPSSNMQVIGMLVGTCTAIEQGHSIHYGIFACDIYIERERESEEQVQGSGTRLPGAAPRPGAWRTTRPGHCPRSSRYATGKAGRSRLGIRGPTICSRGVLGLVCCLFSARMAPRTSRHTSSLQASRQASISMLRVPRAPTSPRRCPPR